MASRSAIEWTDATWNPTTGCTKVSAGCDNCYAERLAGRLLSPVYRARLPVVDTPTNRSDPFSLRIWPDRLAIPHTWKTPRRVFVNSMSDLFHKDIPDLFLRKCFEVMLEADRHTYQVLTKRPARAARFVEMNMDLFGPGGIPSHIWIGTSIEDQRVDFRIRHLLEIEAAVRFLSCEPLIGPLDLSKFLLPSKPKSIHWVIVGGESGPGARVMGEEWVTLLRDQCLQADLPFFFKQWGGFTPKAGGRELEGEVWDEYPEKSAASG